MNKDQAFQMIEEAKVRLLTNEEAVELGKWAESAYNENPPSVAVDSIKMTTTSHDVIDFVTKYTKETRHTPHFSPNFKLVNPQVMPWAVKCFNPKS
jgi:hypothetical protein